MKSFSKNLVKISKIIDPIWYVLALVFLKKNIPSTDQYKSILIFDFHLIGDIVMLTPLLEALRLKFPNAHISLVAGSWAQDILMENNDLNELIVFNAPWVKSGYSWNSIYSCFKIILNLRKRSWDLGIEVRGDIRQILMLFFVGPNRRVGFNFTGGNALLTDIVPDDLLYKHIVDHHKQICKYLISDFNPSIFLPKLPLTEYEKFKASSINNFVGVHFGASTPLRRFPTEEACSLLLKIAKDNLSVIIFVPPDDRGYVTSVLNLMQVDLHHKFILWTGALREMIVMFSRASVMHVMDSGPAHIAAALGVKTIVYFGPNLPSLVRPIGKDVEIKERLDLSCRPCNQVFCSNRINQICLRGLVT